MVKYLMTPLIWRPTRSLRKIEKRDRVGERTHYGPKLKSFRLLPSARQTVTVVHSSRNPTVTLSTPSRPSSTDRLPKCRLLKHTSLSHYLFRDLLESIVSVRFSLYTGRVFECLGRQWFIIRHSHRPDRTPVPSTVIFLR